MKIHNLHKKRVFFHVANNKPNRINRNINRFFFYREQYFNNIQFIFLATRTYHDNDLYRLQNKIWFGNKCIVCWWLSAEIRSNYKIYGKIFNCWKDYKYIFYGTEQQKKLWDLPFLYIYSVILIGFACLLNNLNWNTKQKKNILIGRNKMF